MNPFSSSHSYHRPGQSQDFDDDPPAYNYSDSSFMADNDASRQNATMRLLPTNSADADDDLHAESDLGENPFEYVPVPS